MKSIFWTLSSTRLTSPSFSSSSSSSACWSDLLSPARWSADAWTFGDQRRCAASEAKGHFWIWRWFEVTRRKTPTGRWCPGRWRGRRASCWGSWRRSCRMEEMGRSIWIGVSETDDALSWVCWPAQRLHASGSWCQTWRRRGASAAGPPPERGGLRRASCPAPSPTCARWRLPSSPPGAWCPWCCSPWSWRPAALSSSARPDSPAWRARREAPGACSSRGEGAWGSGGPCGCEGFGFWADGASPAGGSRLCWHSKGQWGTGGKRSNAGMWEGGTGRRQTLPSHPHSRYRALLWCCLQMRK